jgi:hypothetical protein
MVYKGTEKMKCIVDYNLRLFSLIDLIAMNYSGQKLQYVSMDIATLRAFHLHCKEKDEIP